MAREAPPDRRGERIGWTVGWLGGFVWVGLLALVFAVQGRWAAAGVGLGLTALAVTAIVVAAPWRHPSTPYWKLLLPIYGCLAAAVAWMVHYWEGPLGLNVWQLLLLGPLLLMPLWTAGRRRWDSPGAGEPGPPAG